MRIMRRGVREARDHLALLLGLAGCWKSQACASLSDFFEHTC